MLVALVSDGNLHRDLVHVVDRKATHSSTRYPAEGYVARGAHIAARITCHTLFNLMGPHMETDQVQVTTVHRYHQHACTPCKRNRADTTVCRHALHPSSWHLSNVQLMPCFLPML